MVSRVSAFQPDCPIEFLVGSQILISTLGLDVCVLSYIVSGGSPVILLTTHSRIPVLCICLVFWFTICCATYRNLLGIYIVSPGGCKPYIGGG